VESAPATERPSLEAHHRIGTIAGTSVGSLVSLLVDLYFAPECPADPTAPPLPKRWFPSCDGDAATMTVDTNERCALDALEAIFNHTDESDLLCVERGNALELVTSQHGDDHLLRFDPLRERLLVPFFARFGEDLVNNDLVRITVAVDLTQNAALGLDERACRLDPAHTQACLLSAVMTSISEPVFVPPVRRVYSGLYPHEGEGSPADASTRLTWFDGGLRSGTPADFALLRAGGAASRRDPSWSRVLAITTTPLDGVAKTHPRNGLSTFFDSTFDAVDQVRRWEIAHAQLLADARAARLTAFGASRPPRHHPAAASPGAEASPPAPAEPPTVGADAAALEELAAGLGAEAAGKPTLRRPRAARVGRTASPLESASVLPVFVPATMEPRALFAAGYQFDPLMMQGLYLWGELTFLESYERVLRFLRWDDLVTERPEDVAWLTAEHARVSARLCEQFGVSEDCHGKRTPALASDEALKRHYRQRRRAMRRNLAICDDTCPAFPAPRSTCERR
jgi:hypothetical protein